MIWHQLRTLSPEVMGTLSPTIRTLLFTAFFLAIELPHLVCGGEVLSESTSAPKDLFAEIRVVDDQTGRGVPLVELETVNHLLFVTDSAGRIAIHEPGLMGRRVFFHIRSHGYEFPKDGFGNAGKAFDLTAGKVTTLRLKRINIAERLYRITGEGIYRDSVLLGKTTPLEEPLGSGKVAGQDSAFAVPYQGKLFWFWGDTHRMSYPLGHFWMAGAVSDFPNSGGLNPADGVNLNYFTNENGFSRPMCRLGVKTGLIWSDCFITLPDDAGRERLVCHYAHMKSLATMLGHGLAIYDDDQEEFKRITALDLKERWRWPAQAHPFRYTEEGVQYLLMGEVFPTVRVLAQLKHFTNLDSYEAWTCLLSGSTSEAPKVDRNSDGQLLWSWRKDAPPVDIKMESELLTGGLIKLEEAHFSPIDVDSGKRIKLSRGSVNWNPYRQHYIMIAGQWGGTSNLGEIWYSEALQPTGPWLRAKKIITHNNYSFYNPVHHRSFDQEEGRVIYFEGTYVNTFSGNPIVTPRYNYNQIMYRLDLSEGRLKDVHLSE